jgi:C4-dicarboxylate transporter, DctM subunit
MSMALITVVTIILLFVFFLTGMPIGISMALAGFLGFAAIGSLQAALNLVAVDVFSVFSSYSFTVIPLFIFMGQIAAGAGVARRLYDCVYRFIGHVPGGLAIGTVIAGTLFKAVCGSAVATTATFTTIAVPEMDRYNYDKKLSCGVVATVGTLGGMIPPSVPLIIYGLITGASIGRLFLAGILPGLLLAFSFVVTLVGWCKINPTLGPRGEKSTWKARIASLPSVAWVITIFLVVVGGLMVGFFTPTEAGSVGAMAVLIFSILKREITLKRFFDVAMETLYISCMVLMLLAGATILGHFFAVTRTPYLVGDFLSALPINRYIILTLILIVFIIGGEFIEDMAFFVLATPIFVPLVLKLGFDLVWFGIVLSATMMIGVIIPPMAVNVFVVSGITKVPIGTVYKGIYPYIVGMTICVFILMFFPQISLWIPNLLMK